MTDRLNKRSIFYICLAILMILITGIYLLKLAIPKIVLTAVILFIVFSGGTNEIIAISVSCIPLHTIVDLAPVIGFCIIAYVIKNYHNIQIGYAEVLALVILIWEILHAFSGDLNFKLIIGSLLSIFYIIIIMSSDIHDIDYVCIVKSLATVSICICFILLGNCLKQSGYDFNVAMAEIQRLGAMSEDVQIVINPNTVGIINVLAISGLLQIYNTIGQNKFSILLLVSILMIMGMLTASRTFLVLLLIVLIMNVIGWAGTLGKKIRYFAAISLFCLILFLVYKQMFPYNYEFFMSRFEEKDILNGRDEILSEYDMYMSNNIWVLFFGVGLTDFNEKVLNIYSISKSVPHNGFQEIVVAWGIPGLIMMAFLLYLMINESSKYSMRKSLINYISLVVILVKIMAGQLLTSGYTMLSLVLAYLSLCQNFKQTEEN